MQKQRDAGAFINQHQYGTTRYHLRR